MDIQTLFNLNGRVALVTGGSRGIGKMIVEGYLKAGAARVYISARKVDQIEETVAEFGNQVIGLPCDLSTVDGCLSLAAQIAEREEKVDILVNNAGAAWGADFGQFPEAGWDKVVDLNLKAPFFLTQALAGHLRLAGKQRVAKVINIASIDGVSVNPLETYSYAASKAGLIGMTKSLAKELGSRGITANVVAPGFVETDMTATLDQNRRDEIAAAVPLRRFSSGAEIASVVGFLASDGARYITGAVLPVDGGLGMGH